MTKKTKIVIISIIVLIIFFNYNFPLSNKTIAGTYVNKYYDAIDSHHETAGKPDTLFLKADGTLYSKFYGNGKYSISNGGDLTQKIVLHPENPKVVMTFSTFLSNKIYEKTKISLGGDWNCYERIKY